MIFFSRLKKITQPIQIINDEYQKWKRSELKFVEFLDKWNNIPKLSKELNGDIAIVIQPWLRTATPWFMIAIGLFFYQMSKKVTIVLDDLEFGNDKLFYFFQINSIKKILSLLPDSIKIIELSDLNKKGKEGKNPIVVKIKDIESLSTLNTIRFMKGELKEEGRKEYYKIIQLQLKKRYVLINRLFEEKKIDFLFIAGGIYGSSGLFLKLGELHHVRVSTFDAGFGAIYLSTVGIAAQQSDIPLVYPLLKNFPLNKILIMANKEMEKRRLLTDNHNLQQLSRQNSLYNEKNDMTNIGVLILLNLVWDSAALGLHSVFETMENWVIESIFWILKNSNENITIRQHPIEKIAAGKSNDDYNSLLFSHFGENERIRFISATDETNTYNLIEKSQVVVTFSTTASMEAVAMGKVVINVSNCYYSNMGFVHNANSKQMYFSLLKDALDGNIQISDKQKEDALKCYYLSQCCNRIHTSFTPQPLDYEKWVKEDPEDLFQSDAVKDILYALENCIPISLIRHNKIMNINTPPKPQKKGQTA